MSCVVVVVKEGRKEAMDVGCEVVELVHQRVVKELFT